MRRVLCGYVLEIRYYGQPVSSILLQRLPYTLWLDGVALVIMMLVGVLFGLLGGGLDDSS